MQFLKKSFLWILLLGAAGLWVYVDITRKNACDEPLAYTIGRVDAGFRMSASDFRAAVEESALIWEDATGKNLFNFEAEPKKIPRLFTYFIRTPIVMNLVYDERQKIADERRNLVSQVGEVQGTADEVRQQFTSLQEQYRRAAAEYQVLLGEYKKRRGDYTVLEAKRLEVNRLADETNALIKKYNSIVGEVNATVRTINQTAGHEFEEGQYVMDADGERITIYEFGDRTILVRVLAHEFGHALGLDHNDNPDSIMYSINESRNLKPTKEELAELGAICKGE